MHFDSQKNATHLAHEGCLATELQELKYQGALDGWLKRGIPGCPVKQLLFLFLLLLLKQITIKYSTFLNRRVNSMPFTK